MNARRDDQTLGPRALREAARIELAWDRPAYELGKIYFGRRDCESALPWFSRVPPNRPDGPEASFDTGVCHLLRNDAARALELARANLANRPTLRAFEQTYEIAVAAGESTVAAQVLAEGVRLWGHTAAFKYSRLSRCEDSDRGLGDRPCTNPNE